MDWPAEKLVDVVERFHQGLNTAGEKVKFVDSGYPIIQTRNLSNGEINLDNKIKFMSQVDWDKYHEKYRPEIGDVFFTNIGTIGKTAVVSENLDYLIHWNIFKIRPLKAKLSPNFLKYYLDSLTGTGYFSDSQKGGTVSFVTKKMMGSVAIPLPPIPEQQRIVAILDQAFADIEKARANAEQNLKNARELFDSYLQQVSTEKKPLGNFVTIKTGKLNANAAIEKGTYPFFTCSREVFAIDNYSFDCEAILLAGNNASGDFNVKHYKGKFNAYQRTYVITISDTSSLLYPFLYYQMLKSLKELKQSSVGAGTKFLKIDMIKDLEISIPSSEEQQRTLDVLEPLKTNIEKLETNYKEKLASLNDLKKSLLQKAFSGELTKSKGIAA
jgi:type I restriction enzyme S subunit